jgi:hypothetical protein
MTIVSIQRWLVILSVVLVLSSIAITGCNKKENEEISPTPKANVTEATMTAPPQTQTTAVVPSEYSTVYANLQKTLDQFNTFLDKQGGPKNPTIFGAELLPANCNRGEELLKPGVISAVRLYLDRLQELGVKGVTIPIHYPIYVPQFPRFSEYVSFYKQVTREIRNRGMKLDIESHVLFANTTFSPVKWDYSKLTFDQYKIERRDMIARVLNDLHPDFLNIGAEPDTEATLLGMKDLLDPLKYADYIAYLLNGLQRGDTRVVAGVGSWGNLDYARKLAQQPLLDGLSLHVYPVVGECLNKAVQIADLAKTNKKFVVFDECWLSKTDILATNGVASSPENFKRDAYSFWAPLDQEFLTVMVKFSRLYGVVYLSPFWTNFFFAYLEFSPQVAGLSYSETALAVAPAQSNNIRSAIFTSTGEKYKILITQNR